MSLRIIFLLTSAFITISSCKKYLDAKPDNTLTTPTSLKDVQQMLDNYNILNYAMTFSNNQTDEYYLNSSDWGGLQQFQRDSYTWAKEIYIPAGQGDDWVSQYQAIFYANTVLDHLDKISKIGQETSWNYLKGQALFFRSYCFFELSQLYSAQFDSSTASTDLGIVLRLTSDFNKPVPRASIMQTYDKIIQDLETTITLFSLDILPNSEVNKTRPTLPAVYGLLARIFLQTGNYLKAEEMADSCLNLYGQLLDYNLTSPFQKLNDETIFYTINSNAINGAYYLGAKVDSTLYPMYSSNDLRKSLFFQDNGDGTHTWVGNYSDDPATLFTGIATDELYLIRAECNARLGNITLATDDLNTLLSKRYDATFVPIIPIDENDALLKILLERRKELINRGRRWSDLKRLNKDTGFRDTLTRVINGQQYELPPNDLRYSFLIPINAIQLGNLPQNPR